MIDHDRLSKARIERWLASLSEDERVHDSIETLLLKFEKFLNESEARRQRA